MIMLEELKRLNQPIRKEDILFFLQKVIGTQCLSKKDIYTICGHSSGKYQLHVDALISYCSSLELIIVNGIINLSPDLIDLIEDSDELNKFIIERTISELFRSSLMQADMFIFDILNKRFVFKNERLPLSFSSLRNILISQGFFEIVRDNLRTEFLINGQYEKLISSFCRSLKNPIGLQEFRKQLEAQSQAGEKAEQYALYYEKNRLKSQLLLDKIRIISDIDVCAGYDIVSFDSDNSKDYDRFIEVKAISKTRGFYWSTNESKIARLKGTQYFLYLIDLQSISDEFYTPIIINDPARTLFDSEDWLIEPQGYNIKNVALFH